MNQKVDSTKLTIVLMDTNIAYCMYFFTHPGIIVTSDIRWDDNTILKFHPIVQEEAEAHLTAWITCKELQIPLEGCPTFFNVVGEEGIKKIVDFVEVNTTHDIPKVDKSTAAFLSKRKIYETERTRLQKMWRENGVQGRKVTSRPSDNDYSILFSADTCFFKISTNDEILLSIAHEILDDGSTYKAEDIINAFYKKDLNLKDQIEEVAKNLEYMGIVFSLARALR